MVSAVVLLSDLDLIVILTSTFLPSLDHQSSIFCQYSAIQGLVRQKIRGSGTAFLGATGTIVQKVLAEGEVMLVDTNCVLAYSDTCTFDLKRTGGIVNWIGGGEGIFNSSLKGPGLAIVQSMNMRVFLECLAAEKMYRR